MDIQNEDEIQSFSKWMTYKDDENLTDLSVDILDNIHDCSDYRVNGSKYALKFGTKNKLRMSTRMKDSTSELYVEHLLGLKRAQFDNFRQKDMIR